MLRPPRPAGAQVAFHESMPPSQRAGLTLPASALSPHEDPRNRTAPELSPLARSMALPLPSQHHLLAKTHPCLLPGPYTPLPPFSLPIIFVQRREEVPCPPPSQPLEEITGFPGKDAPAPTEVRGPARFSSMVPGAGEMRQAAGRDQAREDPSPWEQPGPPTPTLPCLIPPTPPVSCAGCQQAQLLSVPSTVFIPPLARSKVGELPHRRSGLEQSKHGSGNRSPGTSHPANQPRHGCWGQLGTPTAVAGPGPANATHHP